MVVAMAVVMAVVMTEVVVVRCLRCVLCGLRFVIR